MPTALDAAEIVDQQVRFLVLEHIAAGAGGYGLEQVGVVVVNGRDHRQHVGMLAIEATYDIDA